MTESLQYKSAWIFDLDGTLTVPVHDFAHMRKELGMQPDADILKTLEAMQGEQKRKLTERLDELEAFYAQQAKGAVGVEKLIAFLAQKGCHLGILTRNTKEMALLSLKAIGVAEHFDEVTVIGRDEAPHKPNPQGLFAILDHWQKDIGEAVMVGDFRFDLEVGRAAGTSTVHVSDKEERWPQLTDHYFSSLEQLQEHLCVSG